MPITTSKSVRPAQEIAIKISLGKYTLTEPYEVFMERGIAANRFRLLSLEIKHTTVLTSLPFHHRDPFDRLLVAQAIARASAPAGFIAMTYGTLTGPCPPT
ncbi:MAG: type II toxin-antitoxin system VapC family toxin [Acidobacteria bacterium]|nr:type II toxin-antitoxin system VapC family toxin [Acidobacteriota bacterium]MCI0720355.1 type II toxin-antitoxin system VapC family toxin [Acidobacteriota bacterium]